MTIASIDIGSNSVLLLIAKIDLDPYSLVSVNNYYRAPRISEGLLPGNPINSHKINLLIETLQEFVELCKQHKTDLILVTATAALRISSNAQEVLDLIKSETGLDIKIIDGDTEAFLSFIGTDNISNIIEEKVVVDIGGASTEIVFGNSQEILFKKSFNVGAVLLTDLFTNKFNRELKKTIEFLSNIFNPILDKVPLHSHSIAVAGTPTTLSCIKQNLKIYDESLVDGSKLYLTDVNKIINDLLPLSPDKIKEKYGQVVEGREDILLCGSIILKFIMDLTKLDYINVSSRGLRYGVVINYLKNNQLYTNHNTE